MKTLGTVDCPVSPCSVSYTCLSAAPEKKASDIHDNMDNKTF